MAEVEGVRECLANMRDYRSKLEQATPVSLKEGALFLQSISQEEVPILTAALVNSAYTRMVGADEVQVGYKTAYAVYVHEDVTKNHPNGGKAKFLTDPMEERSQEIVDIISNKLSKVKPRTV